MAGSNCVLAKAVRAASDKTDRLNFIFISLLFLAEFNRARVRLTYITRAPGATLGFPDRLVVRSKVLAGFAAPVDSTGEFVLGLAWGLMKHFLAPQIAAKHVHFR
jgi:hypothetical protein